MSTIDELRARLDVARGARSGNRASACPATLMPKWAAEMIPWMDDAPSAETWPDLMRRLGGLIDRATPATWSRRLQATWCRIAVVEARTHCPANETRALAAIDVVVALLDRAIAGDEPSRDEWEAAAAAAEAATWGEAAAAEAADRIVAAMLDAMEMEIEG